MKKHTKRVTFLAAVGASVGLAVSSSLPSTAAMPTVITDAAGDAYSEPHIEELDGVVPADDQPHADIVSVEMGTEADDLVVQWTAVDLEQHPPQAIGCEFGVLNCAPGSGATFELRFHVGGRDVTVQAFDGRDRGSYVVGTNFSDGAEAVVVTRDADAETLEARIPLAALGATLAGEGVASGIAPGTTITDISSWTDNYLFGPSDSTDVTATHVLA